MEVRDGILAVLVSTPLRLYKSGLLSIDRNSVLVIYKINLTEALSPNLTFAI